MYTSIIDGDIFTYEISFIYSGSVVQYINGDEDHSAVELIDIEIAVFNVDGTYLATTYADSIESLELDKESKFAKEIIKENNIAYSHYISDPDNFVIYGEED